MSKRSADPKAIKIEGEMVCQAERTDSVVDADVSKVTVAIRAQMRKLVAIQNDFGTGCFAPEIYSWVRSNHPLCV